jgi:hypothetical protein
VQKIAAGPVVWWVQALGQIGQPCAQCCEAARGAKDVDVAALCPTRLARIQQALDQSGFALAIGTDEANALAGLNIEGKPVACAHAAAAFGDTQKP